MGQKKERNEFTGGVHGIAGCSRADDRQPVIGVLLRRNDERNEKEGGGWRKKEGCE